MKKKILNRLRLYVKQGEDKSTHDRVKYICKNIVSIYSNLSVRINYNPFRYTRDTQVFYTLVIKHLYIIFILIFLFYVYKKNFHSYLYLNIICTPDCDSTIPDNSPTFRPNDASSKDGCIFPLPNGPKSPFRLAELQSLSLSACASNTSLNCFG